MARRIVRTLIQSGIAIIVFCILIIFADSKYRVLPDAIHASLPSHHAGSVLTDITIVFCSSANPFSKCRLESSEWHRLEKDLYLQAGWLTSAYLHVKHKKEEELATDEKVVVGIKVGRSDPGGSEKDGEARQWEKRPGGIWILRSNKKHASDSEEAVTAVDVLFGPDAAEPRRNWHLASNALLIDTGANMPPAHLTIRYGHAKEKSEITPRIKTDGLFKILQVSDAHLATGVGVCRDAIGEGDKPSANCEADPRTLQFIEHILDDEKPDLVVLSGDQVEGPLAPDTQTALYKMVAPLIERSIPFAAIFGNHDNEGKKSLSRKAQMSLLQALPFSLARPGPPDVAGVGNYYVEVLAGGQSHHSALTLYFLDSHSYSPDERHYHGYDWIKPNQIEWFRSTARSLQKSHDKYSHIHLDMAFIHIPLPEYADEANVVAGGTFKEGVTAPKFNTHFYDALVEQGVVAVGCGHDHVNDYCALRPQTATTADKTALTSHAGKHLGPWMCYAGGSGFGGYAGHGGFHRRVRVWEIDTIAARVTTWKRVECCGEQTKKKIDELVIVEAGHVVAPAH